MVMKLLLVCSAGVKNEFHISHGIIPACVDLYLCIFLCAVFFSPLCHLFMNLLFCSTFDWIWLD